MRRKERWPKANSAATAKPRSRKRRSRKQLRRPHPLPNKTRGPPPPGKAPERSRGASARDCTPSVRRWLTLIERTGTHARGRTASEDGLGFRDWGIQCVERACWHAATRPTLALWMDHHDWRGTMANASKKHMGSGMQGKGD